MMRRLLPVVLVVVLAALVILAIRSRQAPARGPVDVAPVTSATSEELFPLVPNDRRIHTFQCAGFLHGKMFLGFGSRERIGSDDYVIFEIRQQAYETSVTQTFGREWLRADEHGILCAQREEGSVKTTLEPPQRVLELPLVTGKKWEWKGTASGLPCTSESTVVGREKLVLPIGPLDDCWRVDTITYGPPGDKLERSLWYARGLGIVQEVSRIESQGRAVSVVTRLEAVAEPEGPQGGNKPRRRS